MYGKFQRCVKPGSIIHLLPRQVENVHYRPIEKFSVLVIKKVCLCVTLRTNFYTDLIPDDINSNFE